MKKFGLILALTLLALPSLAAQVSNPSIVLVSSGPSGTCTGGLPNRQYDGIQYSCQSVNPSTNQGTWGILPGQGSGGGNISGTITSGPLTMGTGADTVGDSPATFDGTTFVFPNPFSVQAHSAFGVGSAVDTIPAGFGTAFAPAAIAVFNETSTSADGENGLLSGVLWNPATTATDSTSIVGAGGSAEINADSQATANLNAFGGVFDAESLGTTTAMHDVETLRLYSYADGTNTVANQNLINGDLANVAGGTTTQMLLNIETMENAGTTSTMYGNNFVLTNTGVAAGMLGSAIQLTVSGSGTVSTDVSGYQSIYSQSSASANPSDYLGFVSAPVISAGSFSGAGIVNFVVDGENPITTTGTHAIPNYIGFDFEAITAPAHVINNEFGVLIEDVTQGDNNRSIKTNLGPADFGDIVSPGILTLANGSAHITTATGEGWQFNCSDCDTPVVEGNTCTASGDHAGAFAIALRGAIKCF